MINRDASNSVPVIVLAVILSYLRHPCSSEVFADRIGADAECVSQMDPARRRALKKDLLSQLLAESSESEKAEDLEPPEDQPRARSDEEGEDSDDYDDRDAWIAKHMPVNDSSDHEEDELEDSQQ